MTLRRTERRGLGVGALAVAALVGACGADRGTATQGEATQSAPGDLVRLVYQPTGVDAESLEIIADGNRRYRVKVLTGPDAGAYQVRDGSPC